MILAAASGLCIVGLVGCVTTQPSSAAAPQAGQAQQTPARVQNFAKTGASLMPTGTRYTTQALITGVSRDDAGLVITFTELPREVRVRLDFRMAFGQAASDSDMERNLCGVVTAILGGAS